MSASVVANVLERGCFDGHPIYSQVRVDSVERGYAALSRRCVVLE